MSEEKCETCKYYTFAGGLTGECRRRAPVLIEKLERASSLVAMHGPAAEYYRRFPIVKDTDWCGEWEEATERP